MQTEAELLIEIKELKTHFTLDEGVVKAVDGVNLDIYRNRTLCVVGESGCGKSVTAESILQIVDHPGRIVSGEILYHRALGSNNSDTDIVDLAALDPRGHAMRDIRGKDIAMIFQEPMTSLSPIHTIGDQISEVIQLHMALSPQAARGQVVELLRRVGIPRPSEHFDSYPFQLSGGMRQRAMIAMALSCNPSLLIADEPTTAVDVTTQSQILELLMELQAEFGMGILLITHDLGVVAEIADDVAVMYLGRVVERGDVDTIFHDPQHPYTRALLHSIPKLDITRRERLDSIRGMVPDPYNRPGGCPFHTRCYAAIPGRCNTETPPRTHLSPNREVSCLLFSDPDLAGTVTEYRPTETVAVLRQPAASAQVERQAGQLASVPTAQTHSLLEVNNLRMHFPIHAGLFRRTVGHVRAVDDVSFFIRTGETLGLVGESGCGKTTVGRCIMRAYTPSAGEILYREQGGRTVDLAPLSNKELKPYRPQIRLIFQDPYSSLNPRLPVLEIVGEPLIVNKLASGSELEDRVAALLRRVGLRPEYMRRFPHAFSGGERQRLGIARALALDPHLVVADEAVSALDVSVRAQTLNLLQDLQAELDLTYLFISHDLSVIAYLCDRVAVMYVGKLVEMADADDLFANPKHPYTEALLSAVPNPNPRLRQQKQRIVLEGDVADPANPPGGCYFHPRCMYVKERCRTEAPELRLVSDNHYSACHFAEELNLRGIGVQPSLAFTAT
ncbi:MAG: ABC transporter ATP-binding protein [Caldilineaceae bacterium]|nr:ABC transporter ATP-binding protein [Caldilineaceae bacterium]HRJ40608.1 ABC transporter ATP-binding protein [Caldilineaceae bacterium]